MRITWPSPWPPGRGVCPEISTGGRSPISMRVSRIPILRLRRDAARGKPYEASEG